MTCRCSKSCTKPASDTGYHPGHEGNAVNRKRKRGRKRAAQKAGADAKMFHDAVHSLTKKAPK